MSGIPKKNAKEEILNITRDSGDIKCAIISKLTNNEQDEVLIILKCGYTPDEWEVFLNELNFDYASTDWTIGGTIWMEEPNVWYERYYDFGRLDSWWELRRFPEIPKLLVD